jgi:hypothetical protein
MRPREDELIDPEIAEQLDAIDATLAGDPVAPRFAELAELALMLAADRPEGPRPEFAQELDRRVEARFRRVEPAAGGAGSGARGGGAGGGARWVGARGGRWGGARRGAWGGARGGRWGLPALGAAATALVAVAVGIAVLPLGGASNTATNSATATGAHGREGFSTPGAVKHALGALKAPPAAYKRSPAAGARTQSPALTTPARAAVPPSAVPVPENKAAAAGTVGVTSSASGYGTSTSSGNQVGSSGYAPSPVPDGRKITQSSSIQLGTPASRIDTVAQEVFDVIGAVNGIVSSSNVSSGPGASAQFQLRVPSSSLTQALSQLSRLRYANVISRTDNTRDITSSFTSANRRIANAKVALGKLRAKLAVAYTETEIALLRAQIASENATISRAQASLRSLNRQVDYSRVDVSIQANAGGSSSGGGFGLRKAGHDALRVLEVSAGVALIALAVMVPIGLLAALAWWFGLTVRRRRRERALDLA